MKVDMAGLVQSVSLLETTRREMSSRNDEDRMRVEEEKLYKGHKVRAHPELLYFPRQPSPLQIIK